MQNAYTKAMIRGIESNLHAHRKVQVLVPKGGKKAMRKAIEEYFNGAFPINCVIKELNEDNQYE